MGTAYGIYPCGSALVMGKIDGETFLGRLLIFFFGGAGKGKRNSRVRNAETMRRCFAGRSEFRTSLCLCYILYIAQWFFFATTCLQTIAKGVLDPRFPWVDTFAVRLRQSVDLVHALKTVKGLLLLVPPRTPRSSGYDFYAHVVYVVICNWSSEETMCAVVVNKTSCKDRNHRILLGVITPHQDFFFFLRKS
jgi:hypothetical protein